MAVLKSPKNTSLKKIWVSKFVNLKSKKIINHGTYSTRLFKQKKKLTNVSKVYDKFDLKHQYNLVYNLLH
jgi:hypothetical protein